MKKIILILEIVFIMLILSACSGGGDRIFYSVAISYCNTYTPLQPADLVIKDSEPTTLKINSYSDGTKEICILTGNAHISR